jgi:recombination protein RecT
MPPKQQGQGAESNKGKALTIAQRALTIQDVLHKNADKIRAALPKHITVEKMLSVVMNSIRRNPRIAECTPISVFDCVMTSAQLGIPPDDIRGLAYIIPFNNTKKGVMEAQLMPGYKGFIHLAKESGEVKNIRSKVVYEKERFDIQEGTDPRLTHIPLPPAERGKPIGAYTVVELEDGVKDFTFMWEDDIQAIRKRSKAANAGPWVTDPDEMRKKTTIRRDMKMRDLSPKMNTAVALDELMDTEKSVRDSQFETGEFMTEALPGKPEVTPPKAKEIAQEAEVKEPIKPDEMSEAEKELDAQIIDLTIAMEYTSEQVAKVDAMIKTDGRAKTLVAVRKDYDLWKEGGSNATSKDTTKGNGTAGR